MHFPLFSSTSTSHPPTYSFANTQKERKYFDSGDYYLSKAGKSNDINPTDIGREHPVPEKIPHLLTQQTNSGNLPGSPQSGHSGHFHSPSISGTGVGLGSTGFAQPNGGALGAQSGSPVKESSYLKRETSVDDVVDDEEEAEAEEKKQSSAASPSVEPTVSPPPQREGVPIRGAR